MDTAMDGSPMIQVAPGAQKQPMQGLFSSSDTQSGLDRFLTGPAIPKKIHC
jgi:hypothetical protein